MKEKIKLKDVAIHSKGKQINGSDLVEDGMYDYLNGGINPSGKWNEYNTNGCTVTISEGGNSSGYVNYMEEPFWCGAHCYFLSDVNGNPKYLYFALKSKQEQIMNLRTGATMPNIKKSVLGEFEFTYDSSLEEQEKVVSVLERIEKIISYKNEQLHDLDNLIKSRFVEMFGDPIHNEKGWDKLPLEKSCNTIVDCPHSTPNYTFEDTGFMCIRTSIVKKNKILWDGIEYIPEEEFIKRIQRKRPEKGDVIYTREGAILGIAAIIDRDYNVALGQRSMLLSPNKTKCTSEFLSVAMNCDTFLDNALRGVSGSASPHINVGDIKSFEMIMPPIEFQERFATFVQQVDKLKFETQKAIDETQLLLDALMQEYFG